MKAFEPHRLLSIQLQQHLNILGVEMPDIVDGMTSVQRPLFLRDTLLLQTKGSWSLSAPHKLVTPLIGIDPDVASRLSLVCDEDVFFYSPHPVYDDTLTIQKVLKDTPVKGLPSEFGFVFTKECSILFGKDTVSVTQVLCDGQFF